MEPDDVGHDPSASSSDAESLSTFLERLGVKDIGLWRFESLHEPNKRLGKVNFILSNMKATCQVVGHGRDCYCYVTKGAMADEKALRHLITWLHSGAGISKESHLSLARDLKIDKFGMKLRPPR